MPRHVVAERVQPARPHRVVLSLGDHIGALPVIAAVERHHHLAGLDPGKHAFGLIGALCRRETTARPSARRSPRRSSPARSRTIECRPSQPIVRSARISTGPSGVSARTPATVSPDQIRSVASAFIMTLSEANFLPLSRRKLRKSHCGMKAMKGYFTFSRPRSAMRIEAVAELAVHLLQLLMRQFQESRRSGPVRPSPAASRDARCRRENPGRSRRAFPARGIDAGAAQQIAQHHAGGTAADDAASRGDRAPGSLLRKTVPRPSPGLL